MARYEAARQLLDAAGRDLKALANMLDPEVFDDTIFGLHAQQAVEKALKAWVNLLGEVHPFTHNLRLLLDTLQRLGADVEAYWDFVDLSDYAMQLRYEAPSMVDEPLDREWLVREVGALLARVQALLE